MVVDHRNSSIQWEEYAAKVQFDFDEFWRTDRSNADPPVGDRDEELLIDFFTQTRDNMHQTLRIQPIRNVTSIDEASATQFVGRQAVMFGSHVWQKAQMYYESNDNSLRGFSCQKIIEETKTTIETMLANDVDSIAIYLRALRGGAASAFMSLGTALAEAVISVLDAQSRNTALEEARIALKAKLFEVAKKEPRDDDVLLAYIEEMMDSVIDRK